MEYGYIIIAVKLDYDKDSELSYIRADSYGVKLAFNEGLLNRAVASLPEMPNVKVAFAEVPKTGEIGCIGIS